MCLYAIQPLVDGIPGHWKTSHFLKDNLVSKTSAINDGVKYPAWSIWQGIYLLRFYQAFWISFHTHLQFESSFNTICLKLYHRFSAEILTNNFYDDSNILPLNLVYSDNFKQKLQTIIIEQY